MKICLPLGGALAASLLLGLAPAPFDNLPPECSAPGDFVVPCQGLTTRVTVSVDVTDPEGEPLAYQWNACAEAFVTDPTAATTDLIFDTSMSCNLSCGVRYDVVDPGGEKCTGGLYITIAPGATGCSPGYWKNHPESWTDTPYAPSDDFDTVFGVNAFTPNKTLMQALWTGGGGLNKLGRMSVAALLNACDSDVPFPLAQGQVIQLVRTAIQTGQYEPLATQLDGFDNLGCPQN